jgi:Domain of unknown function (DUF4123)
MFSLDHRTFLEQDFAIVDPLLVEGSLWKHLPATPLGQKEFDCDVAQLPHLVCLRDANELTRLELLDVSEVFTATEDTPFFCALLRTAETMPALTRRLSRHLVLTRGGRGQQYFFRYFDPRVFLHLPRILSAEQTHSLLAPAVGWAWFDPLVQHWSEHRVAAQAADGWQVSAAALALTDQQLDSLARIELVNRALRRLQHEQPQHALTPKTLEAIDTHAKRAIDDERLTDADDQVQYALDALHYGPQVHQTSVVRQVLESARSLQGSYVGGMSALGESTVQAALEVQRASTSI